MWLTPRQSGCLCHGGELETSGGDWGPPSKCIVRDRTSLLAFWRVKPRPGQQQPARGQPAPHIKAGGPGRLANCQRRKEQQGSVLPQDNSKLGQGRVCKFQALGRSAGDFTLSCQGSGLISFEGKKKKRKEKEYTFPNRPSAFADTTVRRNALWSFLLTPTV